MKSRNLEIYNVSIDANEETAFSLPDDTVFLELKTRAGTAFKFAFTESETASNFITVPANQSWYSTEKLSFPKNFIFYFLCASNETIEIIVLRK